MSFCLDTNVFFTPGNIYYPMDFCPAYWDLIDKHIGDGSLFIHDLVYQELTKGESAVSDWIKERKESGLVKEFYDDETQKEYIKIAEFVANSDHRPEVIAEFLSGADPWIIATCKVHNFVLVTKETYSDSKKKIKIPNICRIFGVEYIDDFEMIRRLEEKFVLEEKH